MKGLRNISLLLFVLLAGNAFGQVYTSEANNCYKAKDYECAKVKIDSAIISNERFNSQTWQLRGLIYRKLESSENSDYRDISVESFVQARNLDSTGQYKAQIDNFLRNTLIRYYNDAVGYLDQGQLESSENSYVTYKGKYKKYLDAKKDFKKEDVEYYLAIGSTQTKVMENQSGEQKRKSAAKAIHYFDQVLQIDTNQFKPNFNIGVIYYNEGADLIMNMDLTTKIEDIPKIEAQAQENFKKALPYLLRAHRIDPGRMDVVEAIAGCYYGLLDDENYLKFQTILDKKNLPILLEKIQKDPADRSTLEELYRIYHPTDGTFPDQEQYNKYLQMLEKLDE